MVPKAVAPHRREGAVTRPIRTSLLELALLFSRLGATAFGGPAAHIALMQDEVVRRRGWLSNQEFVDLLGATNLIPGPNSTEMAIHIGWSRRRAAGLVVAGVCFILPAMLMTGALGWAYVRFGTRPEAGWLSWGVKPVILAVVAQAMWNLAKVAIRNWPSRILAIAVIALSALGAHELLVLLGAGVVLAIARRARGPAGERATTEGRKPGGELRQLLPALPAATGIAAASAVSLPGLFWVFLKIGSVLFGSGYVLLAFLRADLVQRLHWLTEAQLIDAVAVGQVTPGPVFTTATFIGYLLAGPAGALTATAGIFLPAFVFVAASGPLIPRLRGSPTAGAFLDGVNVASLALMAVVTVQLARSAVVDVPTTVLAIAAAGALLRFRVNPTWLVLGGALIGLLARR
jgi:chromate transporter